MLLTIVTPTYNRGIKLTKLYNSLIEQSTKEFEWIIVDDGSDDDTKTLVQRWVDNAEFNISYFYKENGGKHTALNFALNKIESELTFIVDSDDVLTPDAVETILRYHRRYGIENNICGYTFLRAFPDGKVNGKQFITNEMITSYIESRINSDDTMADKAEVYKTRCLKEFPFPEYEGEKFLGEDIVWIRLGKKYSMVHINRVIYVGEYNDDGLTKNRRVHNIMSPIGNMNRAKEFMYKGLKLKYRIKAAVQYVVYGKFAGQGIISLIKNAPYRWLVLLVAFPSIIVYQKWKQKYL